MGLEGERGLGIVLVSGTFGAAHAAMLVAAGAAALGRRVSVFATGEGVRGLCVDWSELRAAHHDAVLQRRGVAGFGELRAACLELGVQMIACESGLLGEDVNVGTLVTGVETGGLARFLEATREAQMLSF